MTSLRKDKHIQAEKQTGAHFFYRFSRFPGLNVRRGERVVITANPRSPIIDHGRITVFTTPTSVYHWPGYALALRSMMILAIPQETTSKV